MINRPQNIITDLMKGGKDGRKEEKKEREEEREGRKNITIVPCTIK